MMTMDAYFFLSDGKLFYSILQIDRFRTTDKAEKDVSFVYACRANDHVPSVSNFLDKTKK